MGADIGSVPTMCVVKAYILESDGLSPNPGFDALMLLSSYDLGLSFLIYERKTMAETL